MPKTEMIRARIEPNLKQDVENIFKELGLTTTEAISLFYHQGHALEGPSIRSTTPQPYYYSNFQRY